MADGKAPLPMCPELNYTPLDPGTMCLSSAERPGSLGYTPACFDLPNFSAETQAPSHVRVRPPRLSHVTISGKPLEAIPLRVLEEILRDAGLTHVSVSSVGRTPEDQARVMYDNEIKGIHVHYKKPGQKVLAVMNANPNMPRDQAISLMQAKIKELGPSTVSHHCSEDCYVFDVAPSSVSNKPDFIKAVSAHRSVTKFLKPPEDPNAFHIEVAKPAKIK
jgi:predicted RNA binding protein YcfA (HicA-like mRNA interferase family)